MKSLTVCYVLSSFGWGRIINTTCRDLQKSTEIYYIIQYLDKDDIYFLAESDVLFALKIKPK